MPEMWEEIRMVNEKQQRCKCGFKLKRLYSRDQEGYKSQDLFICDKCGKVYEQVIQEKKVLELPPNKIDGFKKKR